MITIIQKVSIYEGWEDDQNLPKGYYLCRLERGSKSSKNLVVMKAGRMIKIFQKAGRFEGWEDDPHLPKSYKL